MIPVPEITKVDLAFGNIKHMPKYDEVPEKFKEHYNPHHELISKWFFSGLKPEDLGIPRPSVNGQAALNAIRAIMGSWEPKHEHKTAGCAMLLNEWFIIPGAVG